jgi:hypothetical protein
MVRPHRPQVGAVVAQQPATQWQADHADVEFAPADGLEHRSQSFRLTQDESPVCLLLDVEARECSGRQPVTGDRRSGEGIGDRGVRKRAGQCLPEAVQHGEALDMAELAAVVNGKPAA